MQITPGAMSNGTFLRRLCVAGFTLAESTYRRDERIRPHAHAHAKISFILAGGTSETVCRTEHRCAAGSAVIKPSDADHSNVFGPVGMRTLVTYRTDRGDSEFVDWHTALATYRWIHTGPVIRHLVAICRLFGQALPGHTEAIEERLYSLMEAIRSDVVPTTPRRSPPWLKSVREYLHAHFTQPIEVRSLAVMAGTHPVYLARVFRRHLGCSVTEYVQRLRTRHAASQLATSREAIGRVAMASGFADHAHLCRVFKSEMGITPGAYRKIVSE